MNRPPTADIRVDDAADALGRLRSLYESDFDRLVSLAAAVVGERALAEELVQDTFAQLLRSDGHATAENVGSYVRTALLNACRSRIRRLVVERRVRRQEANSVPVVQELVTADEELRSAVRQLPLRQRQCIALRFYDDRTVDGIAEILGLSPGSVKTHLHRGLTSLRSALGEELSPETRPVAPATEAVAQATETRESTT